MTPTPTPPDGPGGRPGAAPERWSETMTDAELIDFLCGHVRTLEAERDRLAEAIRTHRNQRADDRCIEDDDRLYEALGDGIKCDRRVGSKEEMLRNCQRFIERRCEGGGWPTYAEVEAERDALRAEVARLQAQIEGHCERIAAQSESLTRRAEGAQQPGHWTKALPTQDGWYWMRNSHEDASMAYVRDGYLVGYGRRFPLSGEVGSEWIGPLDPEGAVTPDALRDAEVRGVRAGLAEAARAAEYELGQYKRNAALCDRAGNTRGGTIDTARGLACERVAETIRAIDPAAVAVGGPGEE